MPNAWPERRQCTLYNKGMDCHCDIVFKAAGCHKHGSISTWAVMESVGKCYWTSIREENLTNMDCPQIILYFIKCQSFAVLKLCIMHLSLVQKPVHFEMEKKGKKQNNFPHCACCLQFVVEYRYE